MYDIVILQKQWIKGLSVRTTNEMEQTNERKIAPLWQQFFTQQLRGGHAPVIGLYSDYEKDENGAYLFTAGQLVDQQLAQDAKEIPGSTYARFQTRKGPIEEVVFETWQQIWSWDQRYYEHILAILNGTTNDRLIQKKRKLIFILQSMKK